MYMYIYTNYLTGYVFAGGSGDELAIAFLHLTKQTCFRHSPPRLSSVSQAKMHYINLVVSHSSQTNKNTDGRIL